MVVPINRQLQERERERESNKFFSVAVDAEHCQSMIVNPMM